MQCSCGTSIVTETAGLRQHKRAPLRRGREALGGLGTSREHRGGAPGACASSIYGNRIRGSGGPCTPCGGGRGARGGSDPRACPGKNWKAFKAAQRAMALIGSTRGAEGIPSACDPPTPLLASRPSSAPSSCWRRRELLNLFSRLFLGLILPVITRATCQRANCERSWS